jgi:hypothetical protein
MLGSDVPTVLPSFFMRCFTPATTSAVRPIERSTALGVAIGEGIRLRQRWVAAK